MRLLVQSLTTGKFLAPSLFGDEPEWVVSLSEAGGGVVFDIDSAQQLIEDWCEPGQRLQIVDVDRLGTSTDYPV